jgi:asparagine N-glycosylation enzyme membrane subunit Stt3
MATSSDNGRWGSSTRVWEVLGKSLDVLFYLALITLVLSLLIKPAQTKPWHILVPVVLSPVIAAVIVALGSAQSV